ncbi:hypothetical protein DMENIID0001_127730 [Sergentomyia squamirostris]
MSSEEEEKVDILNIIEKGIYHEELLKNLSSEEYSSILHSISDNFDKIHKPFLHLCLQKFGDEKLCSLLVLKDNSGRMPFELTRRKHFFCNFLAKLLNGKCMEILVTSFCTTEKIHQHVDKRLNNFLHHLTRKYYTPAICDAFLTFCQRGQDLQHVEVALRARNKHGDTPLHILSQRNHLPEVFSAILNQFGGKLFTIHDRWGGNVFHAVSCGNKCHKQSLLEDPLILYCETHASDPEIRSAFVVAMKHTECGDRTPLHNYMFDKSTNLLILMDKILSTEEIQEIFLLEDDEQRNIFNYMFYRYIDDRPSLRKKAFLREFHGICLRNSTWIREIFAQGTKMYETLLLEEKEISSFAKLIRKIIEEK